MRVYILLTNTETLFTKAIKLYTKNSYNHVSIAFDEQLSKVYSFGRKNPHNPFIGGFVQEQLTKGLFKKAHCLMYSCEVTEEQYTTMLNQVYEVEAEKEKYRYNLIGVLAIAFNKEIKRKNAYFCSQFVATILKEGGIEFHKPAHLVTPDDIGQCPQLLLKYYGKVKVLTCEGLSSGIHLSRVY